MSYAGNQGDTAGTDLDDPEAQYIQELLQEYYGRKNKKGDAVEMLKWQRDNYVTIEQYSRMSDEEKKGKFCYGKFSECERPEYTKQYDTIIEKAGGTR